jgi:hypothetical protein
MPLGSRELPLLTQEHTPLKFARQHHKDVPHQDDHPDYHHHCAVCHIAFSNAITCLEQELSAGTPVERIVLGKTTLTVHYHSQSKLSQQELADLQKATHFDKKELQQWYKGIYRGRRPRGMLADARQAS